MNTVRKLITAAWLVLASHAMADDFTITDLSIMPGETKTISVELNNADNEYIAFEFYMSLPEGVSIMEDEGYLLAELNSSRCPEEFNLVAAKLEDGSYRFLCYSIPFTPISDTSGEILTMTVTASETAEPSVGRGVLFSQVLSDPNKVEWQLEDFTFKICVGNPEGYCPHGYRIGDIDNDEIITVTDLILLVENVMNNDSFDQQGLCPNGCFLGDLNNDEIITITDVMQLVNLILPIE